MEEAVQQVVSPYGVGTALVLGLYAYIAVVVMLASQHRTA